MGDRLLSSAGTGSNCALSIRFPDPSPVLDKNRAPMGPEILSSTGAGVCRKAPKAFPDSSSVLDKFQSATVENTKKPKPVKPFKSLLKRVERKSDNPQTLLISGDLPHLAPLSLFFTWLNTDGRVLTLKLFNFA